MIIVLIGTSSNKRHLLLWDSHLLLH